ncbi:MAG: hypothetical protein Kow00123_23920 [Anaerolineales bacterium]
MNLCALRVLCGELGGDNGMEGKGFAPQRRRERGEFYISLCALRVLCGEPSLRALRVLCGESGFVGGLLTAETQRMRRILHKSLRSPRSLR